MRVNNGKVVTGRDVSFWAITVLCIMYYYYYYYYCYLCSIALPLRAALSSKMSVDALLLWVVFEVLNRTLQSWIDFVVWT